jgi:hypothetical protein
MKLSAEFLASADRLTPEETLRALNIEYRREADGTLVVPGTIDVSYNKLKKLPNFSGVIVQEHFFCYDNELTSLEGAPAAVGIRCGVSTNRLTSLKGAPRTVGEDFWCSQNHSLVTLEGGPEYVGDTFGCQHTQVSSLECAPRTFKRLQSDMGEFHSWKEVPDHLAPETKPRYLKERDEAIRRGATVLKNPVKVGPPLRLKKL